MQCSVKLEYGVYGDVYQDVDLNKVGTDRNNRPVFPHVASRHPHTINHLVSDGDNDN